MTKKQQLNSEIEAAEFGMLADEFEAEQEAGATATADPTTISTEEATHQESCAKGICDGCHRAQAGCICEDYPGQHITGPAPMRTPVGLRYRIVDSEGRTRQGFTAPDIEAATARARRAATKLGEAVWLFRIYS